MNNITPYFIMCTNCHRKGRITGQIPDHCPNCGNQFNQRPREGTITDILYNIFVKNKPEQGYYICDSHGWVKGEQLLFPYEMTR